MTLAVLLCTDPKSARVLRSYDHSNTSGYFSSKHYHHQSKALMAQLSWPLLLILIQMETLTFWPHKSGKSGSIYPVDMTKTADKF